MGARRISCGILATVLALMGQSCEQPVTIIRPGDGTTYTSAGTVTIEAVLRASLAGQNIVTRVEFYDGATLKCTDFGAPYTCGWSFTSADNGTHSWRARAHSSANGDSYYIDSFPVDLTIAIGGAAGELELMGMIPSAGTARDVTVDATRHLAYVASNEFGLTVFDVTNPSEPLALGAAIPSFKQAFEVAVSGSLALALSEDAGVGLQVVDVSDPSLPEAIGSLEGVMLGVAMAGQFAYARLMVPGNPGHNDLIVVDLRNPTNPTIASQVFLPAGDDVEVVGSRVYVTKGSGGLEIFDVSNPFSPQSLGAVSVPNGARALAVEGSYAYVGNLSGLHAINVSNPNNPFLVASLSGATLDLAVSGNRLYATNNSTFRIIDVGNPAAPFVLGTGDAFNAAKIDVIGNLAVLATAVSPQALFAFDVSDPSMPQLLQSFALPKPLSITTTSSRVYVGDESATVDILELVP